MPKFKIASGECEAVNLVKRESQWKTVADYKEENKIVDAKGNRVGEDFQGRKYRLIHKQERKFSCRERAGRAFLATLAVIFSLGFALIAKGVRNLYSKRKETFRIGLPITNPRPLPLPRHTPSESFPQRMTGKTTEKAKRQPKPNREHQKLSKLLEDKNEEGFKEEIASKSPAEILEITRQDGFGFCEHFSYRVRDAQKRLTILFASLSDEQLQAFLKGTLMIEKHGTDICLEAIKHITGEKELVLQEKHYGYVLVAMEENNPAHCFGQLCYRSYYPETIKPFLTFAVLSALKEKDCSTRLSMLNEAAGDTLMESVCKDDAFTEQLTIEMWRRLDQWSRAHSLSFGQMPKELAAFAANREDQTKVFEILDDTLPGLSFRQARDKSLVTIFQEMSVEEITAYVKKGKYFTAARKFEWPTNFATFAKLLPINKQKSVLEATLSGSLETAKKVLSRLGIGVLSSKTFKARHDSLRSTLEELVKDATAKQFLEEFKKLRGHKKVAEVLAKALRENDGDGFKLIAEEMTEAEVRSYAHPKNNCFNLDETRYPPPLDGLFRHLSTPKLKVFLDAAFNWPYRKMEHFFRRLITSALSLEKEKQAEICGFIAERFLQDRVLQYVLFQSYWGGGDDFMGHYLANAAKRKEDGLDLEYAFDIAFKTKSELLEKALKKGLQEQGVSEEVEGTLKAWFEAKKKEEPKRLSTFGEEDVAGALAEFERCRENPDHVRVYLNNSSKSPLLPKVMEVMTVEETARYSTMENNCFGILPSNFFMTSNEQMSAVFNSMANPEKLGAFIKATIEREDCKGRVGLYVTLIANSNAVEESAKSILFSGIYDALKETGQLRNVLDDWDSWHDGKEGKIIPAMFRFGQTCLSKGMNQKDLGYLRAFMK